QLPLLSFEYPVLKEPRSQSQSPSLAKCHILLLTFNLALPIWDVRCTYISQDAVFGEARARMEAEAAEAAGRAAAEAAAEATRRMVAAGGEDSVLDPLSLTVVQLQEELAKRGLTDASVKKWNPLHGKKPLVDKLQEYLDKRRAEVAASDTEEGMLARAAVEARGAAEAAATRVREARDVLATAQREAVAARILLGFPPVVDTMTFTQPGRGTNGGQSRVTLSSCSLEQVLEYGEDDTREASFEVAVFAELFREMLQQRYGRALLRTLSTLLPQPAAAHGTSQDDMKGTAPGPAVSSPPNVATVPAAPATASASLDGVVALEGYRDTEMAEAGTSGAPLQDAALVPTAPKIVDTDATATAAKLSLAQPHSAAMYSMVDGRVSADVGGSGPAGKRRVSGTGVGDAATATEDEPPPGAKRPRRELQAEGSGSPSAAADADAASAGVVSEPFLAVCRMFDERCAGYIEADDLEEIIYMTADEVSRE
ncbi:hypothetical protein Vafri_11330, partial [Volvox africanus]